MCLSRVKNVRLTSFFLSVVSFLIASTVIFFYDKRDERGEWGKKCEMNLFISSSSSSSSPSSSPPPLFLARTYSQRNITVLSTRRRPRVTFDRNFLAASSDWPLNTRRYQLVELGCRIFGALRRHLLQYWRRIQLDHRRGLLAPWRRRIRWR